MSYRLIGLITQEQHMRIQRELDQAARLASLTKARIKKLNSAAGVVPAKAEQPSPAKPMPRASQGDESCNPYMHPTKTKPNLRTGLRGPDRESLNPAP